MTKTREKTNMSMGLVTSMPDCTITLVREEEFKVGLGGTVQLLGEGGRGVERGSYCLDRGRLWVCEGREDGG
jgi:hypothetical protein